MSVIWLVFLVALLAIPIFAHGCHGDDVDHEPTVAPPTRLPEPELQP